MRRKIVAANWKMNLDFDAAEDLFAWLVELDEEKPVPGVEVVVCPPALYLELATDFAQDASFMVGAQNLYPGDFGAVTGEISAPMLASMEVDFVIIGHSERRKYFNESAALLAEKIDSALLHEITPIFCCGETMSEREKNIHLQVVASQLEEALFHLDAEVLPLVVIAYEPVWAIGTGVNATPGQAQEMHAFIRGLIASHYSDSLADQISIIYGGSCTPANASDLFIQKDVDGGLIGGASLKGDEFWKIVHAIPANK